MEQTLVNRENFFPFTPMLHEVAAGDLDMTHTVSPIRRLLPHTKFIEATVNRLDLQMKRVVISHGGNHHEHELEYDHLVLALGAITNFYNLPGLESRSLTVKSLGDAIYLRNHVINSPEEADAECDCEEREPLLTFVVAAGGFAGVETIAAI